jgi:hypothetical protein
MKKSIKFLVPKKRVYWLVAGSVAVLVLVSTTVFMKSNPASKTETHTNSNQLIKPSSESPAASPGSAGDTGITATPLNKTLDEARTEGVYSGSGGNSSYNMNRSSNGGASSTNQVESLPETTMTSIQPETGQPGIGLDANTINQLRSFGIREGDLAKIDRMIAEGFDPKELAKSLRNNGNQNLAAIVENVPGRDKEQKKHDGKKQNEQGKNTANQISGGQYNGQNNGQNDGQNNGQNNEQ